MMDEWMLRLQLVDEEARAICAGLLHRHPALLYAEDGPARVTATVQVLLDATRQRRLLRPWFMQDAQILAIVDRYAPEALRARLSELHRHVWEELDSADVGSLYTARSCLDFLDLDARSLARKAAKLRELVPEFLPSTVLRGCPELLDVLPEELPRHIHRAGDVVVVGTNVRAEMQPGSGKVVVTALPPPPARSPLLAARGVANAGAASSSAPAPPQVVRVFSNSRLLVYANGHEADVRFEDPCKTQQDLAAPGHLATHRMCRVGADAYFGSRR